MEPPSVGVQEERNLSRAHMQPSFFGSMLQNGLAKKMTESHAANEMQLEYSSQTMKDF